MNIMSLSNFLNNTEAIMSNTIENNDLTVIESDEGNSVLISESDFVRLIDSKDKIDFISKK